MTAGTPLQDLFAQAVAEEPLMPDLVPEAVTRARHRHLVRRVLIGAAASAAAAAVVVATVLGSTVSLPLGERSPAGRATVTTSPEPSPSTATPQQARAAVLAAMRATLKTLLPAGAKDDGRFPFALDDLRTPADSWQAFGVFVDRQGRSDVQVEILRHRPGTRPETCGVNGEQKCTVTTLADGSTMTSWVSPSLDAPFSVWYVDVMRPDGYAFSLVTGNWGRQARPRELDLPERTGLPERSTPMLSREAAIALARAVAAVPQISGDAIPVDPAAPAPSAGP